MKFKVLSSLFIILIFLSSFQCSRDSQQNESQQSNNDSEYQMTPKEKAYFEKMEKLEKKEYDFSKNLKPEDLVKYLPEKINGFETLPTSTGTQSTESGTLYTIAKVQFSNDKKQSVIIDIIDYGMGNPVPNIQIYDNPPNDLDVPTEKYQDKNVKGFLLWDEKLKYGRLEVLFENRFVITVRYNRPPNNKKLLGEFLQLVNFEKLKEIK